MENIDNILGNNSSNALKLPVTSGSSVPKRKRILIDSVTLVKNKQSECSLVEQPACFLCCFAVRKWLFSKHRDLFRITRRIAHKPGRQI